MEDSILLPDITIMRIPLTKGRVAIIDACDYELIADFKWCDDGGYARSGSKGTRVYMHRLLLGLSGSNPFVDHINGDGLDNRRCNLRTCSQLENIRNSRRNKRSSSGYKGVTSGYKGSWYAKIRVGDRRIHLGTFRDKESAAAAYDTAALTFFGEFARLNFPGG